MCRPDGEVIKVFSKKKEANEFVELLAMGSDVEHHITKEVTPLGHDDVDNIVKRIIKRIMKNTKATSHVIHLTGATNYRKQVATILEYKGNRKDTPKPIHYGYIRDLMINTYSAIVSENCEADDKCVIDLFVEFKNSQETKDKANCKAIICSIDKDLRTCPGYHYHINKEEVDWVSPTVARKFYAEQMLTGDAADNIPGISKLSDKKFLVGPKTAEKILADSGTTEELYLAVEAKYKEAVAEDWYVKWHEVATLLWMQRSPDQVFDLEAWRRGEYE